MKWIPSKYAEPLFRDEFYEADLWGGRGRGGSHNATMHAAFSIKQNRYFRGYLMRAVQNEVRMSLWQDFKDRLDELTLLNQNDFKARFHLQDNDMKATYLPNGNFLASKGFKSSAKSRTANLKSIAGATHIYIEEFEEVGQEEYYKLADSLRTIKAPVKIIRSWNAPTLDTWFINEYFDLIESGVEGYYRAVPKGIKGHLSIFGTYKDNIKNLDPNTRARYERYLETNPKYYYNQICGLISDGGDKKVYYGWKTVTYKEYLQIDGFEVMGLDFGDTAPTALVGIKYKDGCFYRHQMLYESMRAMQERYKVQMEKIRDARPITHGENNIWSKHEGLLTYVFNRLGVDKNIPIFCDPAQPGLIIELREAGYNACEARKDKSSNINMINRAFNYYTDSSEDLYDEYIGYYLDTDVNKNPIDGKPVKGNDHLMEAQEYGCRGIIDELELTL